MKTYLFDEILKYFTKWKIAVSIGFNYKLLIKIYKSKIDFLLVFTRYTAI